MNGITLIATKEGWVEFEGGPVVQAWCWEWMANREWKKRLTVLQQFINALHDSNYDATPTELKQGAE